MEWLYKDEPFDSPEPSMIGFVYIITNIETGKMYVGKKQFWSKKYSVKTSVVKSGPNKGLKKKKRTAIPIQSDWKEYYGSSEFLQKEIAELGTDKYKREIIRICHSKAEMSYFEIREQLTRDVLLNDNYYNGIINCKIHRSHVYGKVKKEE